MLSSSSIFKPSSSKTYSNVVLIKIKTMVYPMKLNSPLVYFLIAILLLYLGP